MITLDTIYNEDCLEGMTEKKAKMAKIDSGLSQVENWLARLEKETNP